MHKSNAGLLAGLGLAGAMATACTSQVNAPTTVTLVSHDGMAMQAPTSGKITTVEGAWTFGATGNTAGDYPLLLNGSAANGGWAASLQVTNGNLYAFAKSGGHYWIRFNGAWVDIGAGAPVKGTFATKVTVIRNGTKTPDNAPAGTVIATVEVTMSRSGAPFTGRLVSSNALFAFRGMNVVLARSLARKDDGIHNTRITALQ